METWLLFVVVVVSCIVVARILYVLIRRTLDHRISLRHSKTFARLAQYSIIAIGLYFGLFIILDLNFTVAIATLGIVSIVIAFAAQQIIQNLMAGLLMAVDGRVQLEDWVEVIGSTVGAARVKDITLTKTVLLDPTGRQVYVPNAVLINSQFINYTKAGFMEIPIVVKVPTKDINEATDIIMKVAEEEEKVLPQVGTADRSRMEDQYKLQRIHELFDYMPPTVRFQPRVLVTRIDGEAAFLSIRIWIMEVQRKDEIVSHFLKILLDRFDQGGLRFVED